MRRDHERHDHINRAKPDVIHYVDSPKIYEKENTGAVSSKGMKSQKCILLFHSLQICDGELSQSM